jgi:hypothetical protein
MVAVQGSDFMAHPLYIHTYIQGGYQFFVTPSLYSLGKDRIENTVSNSYSIVARVSVAAIRVY